MEEKTKLLAKSRAAVEDGKNWYGVFALKTVITACKILRKSVPYFVGRVKSEKQGKGGQIQVPPEDHISILFRECYNMAYQEMFGVHVDDQSKIGTTGNLLTDKKLPSPAEVDMAISYGMHTHELFEAFILKSSTETTVFRDHMGKVMGNNCDFRSPVFTLVYTFEERAKNKQKWSKYRE